MVGVQHINPALHEFKEKVRFLAKSVPWVVWRKLSNLWGGLTCGCFPNHPEKRQVNRPIDWSIRKSLDCTWRLESTSTTNVYKFQQSYEVNFLLFTACFDVLRLSDRLSDSNVHRVRIPVWTGLCPGSQVWYYLLAKYPYLYRQAISRCEMVCGSQVWYYLLAISIHIYIGRLSLVTLISVQNMIMCKGEKERSHWLDYVYTHYNYTYPPPSRC